VLVYNSIAIYLVPCFGVYFARLFGAFGFIFCCLCKACGRALLVPSTLLSWHFHFQAVCP